MRRLSLLGSVVLAGCATGASSPLGAGIAGACIQYKTALDAADAKGIATLAMKEKQGSKLTPEEQERVADYNDNLAGYLKSSCSTAR